MDGDEDRTNYPTYIGIWTYLRLGPISVIRGINNENKQKHLHAMSSLLTSQIANAVQNVAVGNRRLNEGGMTKRGEARPKGPWMLSTYINKDMDRSFQAELMLTLFHNFHKKVPPKCE